MREINKVEQESLEAKINPYSKSRELGKMLGLDETIDFLCLLSDCHMQYKDIASSLNLSHPSLSRRLIMLQNLNIIKKEPFRSKSRDTHVYALTLRGEKLIKFLLSYEKEINVSSFQQKIMEIND